MLLPRAASLFLKRRPRRSFPIRTARNQVTTNPKQRNKDGAILPALQGCELKNSSLVSRAGTKRTRKPVTAARYSLLPFWAPVFFPGRKGVKRGGWVAPEAPARRSERDLPCIFHWSCCFPLGGQVASIWRRSKPERRHRMREL